MKAQANILTKILADKRVEIDERKRQEGIDGLRERALARPTPPDFATALAAGAIGLIAEVKRRSPSAGVIRDPFIPEDIAKSYQQAGAQAISVLVDEKYFGGGEDIFRAVRSTIDLPMLYKEFVIDEWQVWHAAALGASAILLIAAALPEERLAELMEIARAARLETLFETHDADEIAIASRLNANLIGINNRDLKTFEVSLQTTLELKGLAPPEAMIVSESGIKNSDDVELLMEHGVDAILVGQQLLDHGKDPAREIANLMAAQQKASSGK